MELRTFIKETLEQVLEGIRDAQQTEIGQHINASTDGGSAIKELGGSLINRGKFGVFTRVDFDISVSGETTGGGGLKVAVFGQGLDAGAERKSASANRILFSVPIRLPDGDRKQASDVVNEEAAERMQQLDRRRANKPPQGWMG